MADDAATASRLDPPLSAADALVVVDVQNDFAHPEGSLYVRGGEEVVPVVNRWVAQARDAGALVTYTQDWHPPETPHFEPQGGIWPVHCVAGTWGAELHAGLVVDGPVVRKGTGGEDGYSGFTVADPTTGTRTPTALAGLLGERGVERVVVMGIAGDVCVKATALDAVGLGFATTVVRNATRSVEREPGDEERAFAELRQAGAAVL